jgi:hypothetical protein
MATTDTTLFCAAKTRRILNQFDVDLCNVRQLFDQAADALLFA